MGPLHHRRAKSSAFLALVALSLCAACDIPTPPHRDSQPLEGSEGYRACATATRDSQGGFCDVPSLANVSFRTFSDGLPSLTIADFDGDGKPDIFATDDRADRPALLLNRWPDFVDVTESWGLAAGLGGLRTSAAADLDDDGDPDLMVSIYGGNIRVFRNEGSTFTPAGTVTPAGYDVITLSFADLDVDGRLDLLLGNFREQGSCGGSDFHVDGCPSSVEVFRQTAPFVFEPVTVDAPHRRVLALRALDWDGDGRDEVLVGSDVGILDGGNLLLRVVPDANGLGFSMRDDTAASGFGNEVLAMGISAVDADGDGRDEILVSNLGYPLLLSRGDDGSVVDHGHDWLSPSYGVRVTSESPAYTPWDTTNATQARYARFQSSYLDENSPAFPTTKWSSLVWDCDDDGRQDVFLTAGYIGILRFPEAGVQTATLLRGNGNGFDDATSELGLRAALDSYGAAAADFDGDGDLDLAVAHASPAARERVHVLRNDASVGHALTVIARGRSGRDGIGARVTIRVGAVTQSRRVDGSGSLFGGGPHEAHFGLGGNDHADELTVRFPSGTVRTSTMVPAGRVIVAEKTTSSS